MLELSVRLRLRLLYLRQIFYIASAPPGVNFINLFTRSFYANRSQKRKKLLDLTVFFALLGSVCEKAAQMMVKLTPGFNGFRLFISSTFCSLTNNNCTVITFSRAKNQMIMAFFATGQNCTSVLLPLF